MTQLYFNTRSVKAIVLTLVVYLLFAWLYFIVVLFNIWRVPSVSRLLASSSSREEILTLHQVDEAGLWTGFFTLFFLMMVWSHLQCVIRDPGFMPQNYSQLQESKFPKHFYDLLHERESLYRESKIRMTLRKASRTTIESLSKLAKAELQQQQLESIKSIFNEKGRNKLASLAVDASRNGQMKVDEDNKRYLRNQIRKVGTTVD